MYIWSFLVIWGEAISQGKLIRLKFKWNIPALKLQIHIMEVDNLLFKADSCLSIKCSLEAVEIYTD